MSSGDHQPHRGPQMRPRLPLGLQRPQPRHRHRIRLSRRPRHRRAGRGRDPAEPGTGGAALTDPNVLMLLCSNGNPFHKDMCRQRRPGSTNPPAVHTRQTLSPLFSCSPAFATRASSHTNGISPFTPFSLSKGGLPASILQTNFRTGLTSRRATAPSATSPCPDDSPPLTPKSRKTAVFRHQADKYHPTSTPPPSFIRSSRMLTNSGNRPVGDTASMLNRSSTRRDRRLGRDC